MTLAAAGIPVRMQKPRWVPHVRVLGSFVLIFMGVGGLGLFITAAGRHSEVGSIALAVAAVACFGAGVLLMRFNSHHRGGLLGPRPEPTKQMSYHPRRGRRSRM